MLALGVSSLGAACRRESWLGVKSDPTASQALTTNGAALSNAPNDEAIEKEMTPLVAGQHPRILLSKERLDALEALAALKSAPESSWAGLLKNCNENGAGGKAQAESGYEAEDWANFALNLALCGRVLKKPEYTRAAVTYFDALLDDKEKIGDKAGGLPAVQANDGYSIRNRGFLTAIAYDWLYDALSAEKRKHAADQLDAFCKWYSTDGYKHDDPIANHYMSYFGACAMGGVALEGEDPRGGAMRKRARGMFEREIIPAYKRLGGGDFPEGWQYARIPGAALGFFVDAESRATGRNMAAKIPWLRESVAFQAHALMPDGLHCWDNADWSKKPALPFAEQLYASALALPADDAMAKRALFLARLAKRPDEPHWDWLQAIGDIPSKKGEDPKQGATSYLAPGTGTMFARTDWSPDAIWVGMNASPAFGDHQHLDQGHFEITRGADALLIDPGDYDSYSTMSHNSILVDDNHENLRWSPNQGIWGKDISITRFQDNAGMAYAEGTFGAAYNPDGYPEDHRQRSVTRAERELVFSRSAVEGKASSGRLVIYDRVTLTKPSYGVTWIAHSSTAPQIGGGTARISVGKSSAMVSTLLPANANARLLTEPTLQSDEMFTKNDPAEGVPGKRIEIDSPKGATERRFLHVIAIGAIGDHFGAPQLVPGEGAEGAAIDGEAYLFVTSGPQRAPAGIAYRAPITAIRHFISGLAPNGHYAITANANGALCQVAISPGGAAIASTAGTLMLEGKACVLLGVEKGDKSGP